MMSIFGVGNCKISIFGLWRSTLLGNNCLKLLAYLVNNIKSDHNREKPNKIRWEHQQNFQNIEVEFLDLFNYPSPYCNRGGGG